MTLFSRTITIDGVTAEIDLKVDVDALAIYLGRRAMGNRSARATLTKAVIGPARTNLVIAEVRKGSRRRE